MNLDDIHSAYFIGIGGIGMSALAKYFHSKGVSVQGYDRVQSEITQELEAAGMIIHYEENIEAIPDHPDIVVYTPAVPRHHAELVYLQKNNFPIYKRSEILKEITKNNFTIAVAGTHGKTTVSSMIAHILKHSGYDCSAFLGGITVNYNSNFISGKNEVVVVEADEFDRSFLNLAPDIAVVTAIDPDHMDIYGSKEALVDTFYQFIKQIRPDGKLIIKYGLPLMEREIKAEHITYSFDDPQSFACSKGMHVQDSEFYFDYKIGDEEITGIKLVYPGIHNVENAVAAITVAKVLDIEDAAIKAALLDFRGIKRRFEILINREDLVYIDDYAHHPEEINKLLQSVRMMYPGKKVTAVFQPHLYSRTRDFADEFAATLGQADDVILLPVYPAREEPIRGVNSEMIVDRMEGKGRVLGKSQLLDTLARMDLDIILTIGAGDIDRLVKPVKKVLTEKHED